MKYSQVNNVKIYSVNSNESDKLNSAKLSWSASSGTQKNLRRKFEDFEKRIHLLQDFEFPTACNRMKYSRDGRHLLATGTYKPHMRIFDLGELSLKTERYTESESVTFEVLDDDLKKMVFLQNNQTLEFHAHFGNYHTVHLPIFGRDMLYYRGSCDLYIGGATSRENPGIVRLNLDEGRHNEPFSFPTQDGLNDDVNVLALNEQHQFIAAGGVSGLVHVYDPRSRSLAGTLDVGSSLRSRYDIETSALVFSNCGMQLAAGTSDGIVAVYDIRGCKPLAIKDHHHETPIKRIQFHNSMGKTRILSADEHSIRIWGVSDRQSSAINATSISNPSENTTTLTTISSGEKDGPINDFVCKTGEGLILVARDAPTMDAFYIPDLGVAPRWCHFLDTLAEELEETSYKGNTNLEGERSKAEVGGGYDNYVFCTLDELRRLGLDAFLDAKGSHRRIHPYMHGYYVDKKTYKSADAALDVNVHRYEDYLKSKITAVKTKERTSIASKVLDLDNTVDTNATHQPTPNSSVEAVIISSKTPPSVDPRFAVALAASSDFAIDPNSHEYETKAKYISKRDSITNTKSSSGSISIKQASLEDDPFEDNVSISNTTQYDTSASDSESDANDMDSGAKELGVVQDENTYSEDESDISEESGSEASDDDGIRIEVADHLNKSSIPLGVSIGTALHKTTTRTANIVGDKEYVFTPYKSNHALSKEKVIKDRKEKLDAHMIERAAARRKMSSLKNTKSLDISVNKKSRYNKR